MQLTLHAAAAGRLDLQRSRPNDYRYQRYLSLFLQAYETSLEAESAKADSINKALSWPHLQKDVDRKAWHKEQVAAINAYQQKLRPWVKFITQEESVKARAEEDRGSWEAAFGKLDDPETLAKIAQTRKLMAERRAKPLTE